MKFVFRLFAVSFFIYSCGRSSDAESFISSFKQIGTQAKVVGFTNPLEVSSEGGHLQGVQIMPDKQHHYAFVTGSCSLYSYYAVIKLDETNEVIAVQKLMDKPYKHAGGFQIFQNYLAVGIEDNEAKDKSKVCIYAISNPENPPLEPIAMIERKGSPLRSTAGCVGMTKHQDQFLIVVADWDSKHLDFYACKSEKIIEDDFDLVGSIDIENHSREGWINPNWWAYQNINLFSTGKNQLFLIGLGQDEQPEHVADLFRLSESDSGKFKLTKVASKTFNCEKGASFKAGAGVEIDEEGRLRIVSCAYTMQNYSYLNYFEAISN
ncbi:hypothetical protein [Sunxiuqinia sp. sy24]|uniref:hypothetical protein n=1 Tax=Sunxiuqinia sp. sy24 TaxID=3461495 RepID=UPI00404630CE